MSDTRPPSTRAIHAAFDFAGRNGGKLALGLVGAVLAVFLASGFYVVKKEELGVRTRFGRVIDDNVEPGWHYSIPIIEKTHVRKVLRIEAYQVASSDAGSVNFTILSGDTNLLEIAVAVQYRIDHLRNFLFASDDPIQVLTMLIREELVQIIGQNFIDLILTLNRNIIQQHMEQTIGEDLERHDIGLELVALNIVDVRPVEETRAAFRDVSDAIADKAQAVSNANRDRERFLARSRGPGRGHSDGCAGQGHGKGRPGQEQRRCVSRIAGRISAAARAGHHHALLAAHAHDLQGREPGGR